MFVQWQCCMSGRQIWLSKAGCQIWQICRLDNVKKSMFSDYYICIWNTIVACLLNRFSGFFFKHLWFLQAHLQEFIFKRPYPIALRSTLEMFSSFGVPHTTEGSNIMSVITAIAGVKVRLYQPIELRTQADGPALIFIHGGGFFLGSPGRHNF